MNYSDANDSVNQSFNPCFAGGCFSI